MASSKISLVLTLTLLLTGALFYAYVSAETFHFYPGPDTSPDGLTLTDFIVETIGDPETSGVFMISFILSNSPDNPVVTLTEKGVFVAAVDPEGTRRYFEFSYPGETMSPGTSLIFNSIISLDLAGEWRVWPSYEILFAGSDSLLVITRMGPDDWHSFTLTSSPRYLPDLTPLSIYFDPEVLTVGQEASLILTVKNVGDADTNECHGAFFVGSSLESSFPIPAIDRGESVDIPISWVPPQQGIRDLIMFVDYWNSVTESNEENNIIEVQTEITSTARAPLEIVSGPMVADITYNSVTILWETSEESDSAVEYGTAARRMSIEEIEPSQTITHRVRLTDLKPSTTYHFNVVSRGEDGGSVSSRDQTFQTLSLPDEAAPRVSLPDLGARQGMTTIQVDAQDDVGVEMVEFYLNDVLVFTDYSAPYSFTIDTSAYEDGLHKITTNVHDFSGQFTSQSKDVEFLNPKDSSAPTVDITFPKLDDNVSGKIQVTATLSDDKGLGQAFFKVDGGFESFQGFPTNPKSSKVSFTLDTSTVSNGRHRLSVEAFDKEGKYGYDTVDVWVSQPPVPDPPKLKVKSHIVTRQSNYFIIGLTVENVGGTTATNVVIQDFLWAFQPISGDDVNADYLASFTPSTMYGDVAISSKMVIHPKQYYTYTFQAVPVLVHPESDFASKIPSIGDPIKLWYEDQKGKTYFEESKQPVPGTTNGETITSSYDKAVKSADYLIVTNPQRLGFYSQSKDVDDLLSTMAKLARYRSGVLGYSTWKYAYYEQVLQGLIKDGGSWSSKLVDGWSSNGFLLIVGETEIIPSWNRVIGTFYTTLGDYTWKVFTDNPYANTYGDERKPELSIARIIGSNAKELKKVIETSLKVLLKEPGYGFDRSKAILVSGFPSNLMGGFDGQVDAVANAIKKKTPSVSTDKIDTPDFKQYNPSTGKINENYTNLVVDSVFFGATNGRSIIFLAGHGNWDHWDKIDKYDVSKQIDPFGWTNPFVFASSCKTGIYSGVTGISEAFLQKGAAVYLGAVESGGWTAYSTKFFDSWDLNEPISQAVKQVKASLGDEAQDKIWLNVYHVYGDAKFGVASSTTQTVGLFHSSIGTEAPTWIDVKVPDYEVVQTGGNHRIIIPGGYELYETGRPVVPVYTVTYNYPEGCQIQDVVLAHRSPPQTLTDLDIPESIMELPFTDFQPLLQEQGGCGCWPDRDYKWSVSQTPEGSVLTITVYPLIYDPETRMATFFGEYGFTVDYTISSVGINRVLTDKRVYSIGEPVSVDIELENRYDERDVILEAYIADDGTGEVIDGLELRTLKALRGNASLSCTWDSSGFEPGNRNLIVELRDTEGVLLDSSIEGFTIGVSYLEVTALSAEPDRFQRAEDVDISMSLHNGGELSVTCNGVIKIIDSEGNVLEEFTHEVTGLPPAESLEVTFNWDVTGLTEGVYKVVGFALYEGGSTLPVSKLIGADNAPPSISHTNPLPGTVIKNLVNLETRVSDQSEVTEVFFSIQTKEGGPEGYYYDGLESMPATHLGGDSWQSAFNTTHVPDGSYLLTIFAVDAFGNRGEETVEFSILNAPVLSILTQKPGVWLTINGDQYLTDSNGLLSVDTQVNSYTVEAQPIVELSVESRALFVEWEDGTELNPRTFTVTSDTTIMARYRTQHLLTIISPHGAPVGGGWYDEGAEAVFSVTTPTGFIPKHIFTGWRGDSDEAAATSRIVMDGPKTVTASWETSYASPFMIVGVLAVAALGFIALKLFRKQK